MNEENSYVTTTMEETRQLQRVFHWLTYEVQRELLEKKIQKMEAKVELLDSPHEVFIMIRPSLFDDSSRSLSQRKRMRRLIESEKKILSSFPEEGKYNSKATVLSVVVSSMF